jgi:hypothetical protein
MENMENNAKIQSRTDCELSNDNRSSQLIFLIRPGLRFSSSFIFLSLFSHAAITDLYCGLAGCMQVQSVQCRQKLLFSLGARAPYGCSAVHSSGWLEVLNNHGF